MTSSKTSPELDGTAPSATTTRHLRRNWFTALAVFTVMALLLTGFELARTASIAQAQTRFSQAVTKTHASKAEAQKASDAAQPVITEAQEALNASAGHTLDESARETLSRALDISLELRNRALLEIETARDALRAAAPAAATPSSDPEPTLAAITELHFTSAPQLRAATQRLTAATDAVTAAVAAWQAEQDRIAAEAAAQAAAAAAAARPAATNRAGDGTYQLYVASTSGAFQAALDACNGAVDISDMYFVNTAAAHWSCGGSSFPRNAGATVRLSGAFNGLYQVVGVVAVLDAASGSAGQVPRDYDVLFQTCLNNNSHTMAFVGLTRIG